MTERDVLRDTRLLLANEFRNGVFWRNSTGMADAIGIRRSDIESWIRSAQGPLRVAMQVALGKAHRMRFGLAPGSSDLIGCVDGRFVAPEAKYGSGRASKEQEMFQALVQAKGGVAFTFWTPEECVEILRKELQK